MNQKREVYVYSIPNCPYCYDMKKGLLDKGINYTEIDVSLDKYEDEFDEVVKITGTDAVPTVLVDKLLLAPDVNFWSIEQGISLIEKLINED